jgi:hypothetical protein
MFKKELGFWKNQIVNPIRDRREWEKQHGKERTPFIVSE